MVRPSRQVVVVGSVLLLACAWAAFLVVRSTGRMTDAGFWFETVSYESRALGGPLTAEETAIIKAVAAAEIEQAFRGLRIEVSDRRDARYRVRVVQSLHDPRFGRSMAVAGASRAVPGLGGAGAVSFTFVASAAVAYAPAGLDRASIVEAIGRGIGRTAVHELAHQLLGTAMTHSADAGSYEHGSASRPQQYYGPMHWDTAWPLLHERLDRADDTP